MSHYSQKDIEDTVERSEKDFSEHVLTQVHEGLWKFAKPGTWCYGFYVFHGPGCIMMYGDLGEVMFIRYGSEGLAWLRGVMDCKLGRYSVGYLAEKVPNEMGIEQFSKRRAKDFINEEANKLEQALNEEMEEAKAAELYTDDCKEEENGRRDEIQELRETEVDDFSTDTFYTWLREGYHPGLRDIDELPNVEEYTWHFLFQLAALWHFCRAMDARDKELTVAGFSS